MTTSPAASSRAPSIPLKESMNATSSPPTPALCTTRPAGASFLAAATMPFSIVTSVAPLTALAPSRPIRGTETLAVVPSLENDASGTCWAATPEVRRTAARSAAILVLSAAVSPPARW
jgi:hypothetical protein